MWVRVSTSRMSSMSHPAILSYCQYVFLSWSLMLKSEIHWIFFRIPTSGKAFSSVADWQKSKSCSEAFQETRRGCTIGDQLPGLPSTCYPPSSLCIVILSHCAAWTRNYPLPGQEDLNCHCWTLIWPMSPQHCNLNLIGTATPISRLPLYHQLTDIICDVNSPLGGDRLT